MKLPHAQLVELEPTHNQKAIGSYSSLIIHRVKKLSKKFGKFKIFRIFTM